MLFFFKEKPIEIIVFCLSSKRYALEFAPVKPAKEVFPQWWKDTESGSFDWNTFSRKNTTKSCVGIINQISTGLIFPMWCDLAVRWNNEGFEYSYADEVSKATGHNLINTEAPNFLPDHHIMKIISPWFVKSKVKLQYMFPYYHHLTPPNFNITPGIVTPIKGYSAANIFLTFKKSNQVQNLMIKNNTPIMQAIPLTDKKVVYRIEEMSERESLISDTSAGAPNFFFSAGLKKIFYQEQNK